MCYINLPFKGRNLYSEIHTISTAALQNPLAAGLKSKPCMKMIGPQFSKLPDSCMG
jgi:hypothetical protein